MYTDDTNSINSKNAESNILTEILHTLKTVGKKDIWSCRCPRMLFKYYLVDAQTIASSFVAPELNAINKVFKKITNQYLFFHSDSKSHKVNKISSKFGDQSMWQQQNRHQLKNPKSLKHIEFKIMSSALVPKATIAVSVAHIKHAMEIKKWENDATVPLTVHIQYIMRILKCFHFQNILRKGTNLNQECLIPHIY